MFFSYNLFVKIQRNILTIFINRIVFFFFNHVFKCDPPPNLSVKVSIRHYLNKLNIVEIPIAVTLLIRIVQELKSLHMFC